MKIGSKIMFGAAGAVIFATIGAIVVVFFVLKQQHMNKEHDVMSSAMTQAQSVMNTMESMHKAKMFDMEGLLKRAKEQAGTRELKSMYDETDIYKAIPVVAAWDSVEAIAGKNNYTFKTPSRPDIPARNDGNNIGKKFQEAFDLFAKSSTNDEYFGTDDQGNIVLAAPVRLTESCLTCHGDPKNSVDGKDPLGFPMENMKVGDVKGAFVLTAPMDYTEVYAATMKLCGTGLAILVGVLIAFAFLNKKMIVAPLARIVDDLAGCANQTESAASQVASGSQALADGTSKTAAALEETSASMEEMASLVKNTSQNTQSASALANEARTNGEKGAAAMQELSQAIAEIKANADQTAKIVKTIDEIAFQTNLLALNAAVEAARAGDAGKGFAVVAEEVRNLAQRAGEAARNTSELIEKSVKSAETGVSLSKNVGQVVGDMTASTRKVNDLVTEIAASAKEIAQGIDQVSGAVRQMDQITQANAAGAEENSAVGEEMSAQSQSLSQLVRSLEGMIRNTTEGNAQAIATPAPVRATRTTLTGKSSLHLEKSKTAKGLTASNTAKDAIPFDDDSASDQVLNRF
jgi:methyl-accepting chemotaxis protein